MACGGRAGPTCSRSWRVAACAYWRSWQMRCWRCPTVGSRRRITRVAVHSRGRSMRWAWRLAARACCVASLGPKKPPCKNGFGARPRPRLRGRVLRPWKGPRAVHVEIAQHLPASALHEEVAELLRVLSRFRWRLGFERTLRFGLRGAIASGLTLIGVSVISWAAGVPYAWWPAGLPLLAALALGLARWPSHAQAALAVDRRLALEERLGTAVELAQRRSGGRFDALQVRDAVARARSTPGGWLTLDRHFRREAWLAAGVVVLAAASLLLARLPAPQRSFVDETGGAAADAVPSVDLTQRELPPGAEDIPLASAQPVPQTKADAGLAARVQQEQSERTALDNLSQALGSVSAGQPAANAIQQGDFGSARSELQNLGDEADQLSDAAKQQLGKALQDAAAASA